MAANGKIRPKCSIEGCDNPNVAHTYCAKHHRRFQRHGDPLFINPKCNRDGNYIKRARVKTAKWKKANPGLTNYYIRIRKQVIKRATLKGVENALKQIYIKCPHGLQVDHILPVKGELISGLNVPWNTQYLTPLENNCKNDKFDGTYENESWRKDMAKFPK